MTKNDKIMGKIRCIASHEYYKANTLQKERGGIMTMEDLAGYNVTIDEPLKFQYRGQSIISAPPPASGHVIALTLQILDNFDLASYGTLKAWNYIIEAMR